MLVFRRNMSCLASVLRYSDYGDPAKVIKLCTEKLEAPENDKILVKILQAPINPADINTIQGKYPVKPTFPAVGGNECVAEVVEVGSNVSKINVGDIVVPFATGESIDILELQISDKIFKNRSRNLEKSCNLQGRRTDEGSEEHTITGSSNNHCQSMYSLSHAERFCGSKIW